MAIQWNITPNEVDRVKLFVKENEFRNFVKKRKKENIELPPPSLNRNLIWEVQFDCILSTQQKSGPSSAVAKFMHEKPFPFEYSICSEQTNLKGYVTETFKKYSGIRFIDKISRWVELNYSWFNNGGWERFEETIDPLIEQRRRLPKIEDQITERYACEAIRTFLMGIGPKQARNYLQLLGLTRYEIPIDIRFLHWLKEYQLPIDIEQKALSYPPTYNAVLDKIQELCIKAGLLPSLLDACVFARNDEEWPDDYN